MDEFEKRWERMKEQLLAQAAGEEPARVTSTRTLFGIPSTVEQTMERFAGEIEEERAARVASRRREREELMENHPVLDVADVVALEQRIADDGTPLSTLMERAGAAVAEAVCNHADEGSNVTILAGTGNNGGDGWVAARLLAESGRNVTLACPVAAADLTAEPARSAALEAMEYVEAHTEADEDEDAGSEGAAGSDEAACDDAAAGSEGTASSEEAAGEAAAAGSDEDEAAAEDETAGSLKVLVAPTEAQVARAIGGAKVVVDALVGTGFESRMLRDPIDSWVRTLSGVRGMTTTGSGPCVVACDVPSGVNAQTGTAARRYVKADETITMLVLKPGLLTGIGARAAGEVTVAELCDVGKYL